MTLFTLTHVWRGKSLPKGFIITTILERSRDHGDKVKAALLTSSLQLFVQGPAAEDTEAALRALHLKVEAMVGKRWKSFHDRALQLDD